MNNKAITFDELPEIVAEINRKIDLLLAEYSSKPKENEDFLMTMEDLRTYLPEQPARQTVYEWVLKRKIPFEKFKGNKRLWFRKSAIDNWLSNGRQV